MSWKGFKDIWATIIIDVTKSEEELLKNAERSRRKNINKAKNEGLSFTEAFDSEWREWYPIYCKVWREGGNSPVSLEEMRKPNYKLYLAKKNGKILGGGVFKDESDKITFMAYAALIEYQDLRVNDFLYWNSILYAKNTGKKYVDLGGWQINASGHLAGVNRFKEMWGGKIKKDYIYSYNPFYVLGRKAIRNSKFMRWIWDRIKGRPLQKKKNLG